MPRAARRVLAGVPHHVVLRGNNRRRLFSYRRDYLYFISLLCRYLSRSGVLAHALCLMPNHAHLLLTPLEATSLGVLIKRSAQRYAQVRNNRFATTGKLFEQRYYSAPMRSEAHLAVATAYIDLNPVRAGLVADAADYPWSTLRLHAGLGCSVAGLRDLWSGSAWYLGLGPDARARALAYRRWVDECRERDAWGAIRRDPPPPAGGAPTRPNRSRAAG